MTGLGCGDGHREACKPASDDYDTLCDGTRSISKRCHNVRALGLYRYICTMIAKSNFFFDLDTRVRYTYDREGSTFWTPPCLPTT
jgi:hypothetical protein